MVALASRATAAGAQVLPCIFSCRQLVRKISEDLAKVVLHIEDAGKGIPENVRLSILSSSRSERQASSGLGLAGMRERLHQIGGQLEIDSMTGKTVIRAIVTLDRETKQST